MAKSVQRFALQFGRLLCLGQLASLARWLCTRRTARKAQMQMLTSLLFGNRSMAIALRLFLDLATAVPGQRRDQRLERLEVLAAQQAHCSL